MNFFHLKLNHKPLTIIQTNASFQFKLKKADGQEVSYSLLLKSGTAASNIVAGSLSDATVTVSCSEDEFVKMASGKLNGWSVIAANS